MKCPACGFADSRVIDSRPTEEGSIRRRRECLSCKRRFTTYEIFDAVPIMVTKKDGSSELFDKNKIYAGVVKSCYKRPITKEQIDALVADVEQEIRNRLTDGVTTSEIGVMVMNRLRDLDEVSYVRFASVYREFKDADTFMQELQRLKDKA
ncbi:MAG: transcriptional repressor NrdR [Clostridiales bacterium]|nr:transcriptional repressor NrdR [Clostridiales bacterium]